MLRDVFYWTFYWLGIAMAVACVFLVLAGNTENLWRFEHTRIPWSWAVGIGSILAFVVAESFGSEAKLKVEEASREASPQLLPEEAVF